MPDKPDAELTAQRIYQDLRAEVEFAGCVKAE